MFTSIDFSFRSEVINHDHMRHHRCTGRREQSERTHSSAVSRRYEKKSKEFPELLRVHVLLLSGWPATHQMRIWTMFSSAIEHFYSSIRSCRFMTHFASIMYALQNADATAAFVFAQIQRTHSPNVLNTRAPAHTWAHNAMNINKASDEIIEDENSLLSKSKKTPSTFDWRWVRARDQLIPHYHTLIALLLATSQQ